MKLLVACEESQTVCKAFRERGHEAYSCDILDCSGGHNEWHIKQDVLPLLNGSCVFYTVDGMLHYVAGRWDLIIAHPPCTYVSNAGARHLYPRGVLNVDRLKLGLAAKDFFMNIYNADCDKICIENPIPSRVFAFPEYSQILQPYEFGHPYKKRTCLWLKNLPLLRSTNVVDVRESTKIAGNWFNKGGKDRQKNRSKTFDGIAKAMAEQWG